MQHPVRAESVDAIAVDHGRAARPVVVTVHVLEAGRVAELPELLAGFAIERDEPLAIGHAIELEEPPGAGDRRTVASP